MDRLVLMSSGNCDSLLGFMHAYVEPLGGQNRSCGGKKRKDPGPTGREGVFNIEKHSK